MRAVPRLRDGSPLLGIVMLGIVMVLIATTTLAEENNTGSQDLSKIHFPQGQLPLCDGGAAQLPDLHGKKATVVAFLSTQCPISNGYLPTLNRIVEEQGKSGVQVLGINPNAGPSLRDLAAHHREYDLQFPVLKDAGGRVATQLGVTTTPEVCLFDAEGKLRYRGRIDDRYSRRGGSAAQVRQKDLLDALSQVLADKPVTNPLTEAVGCPLVLPQTKPSQSAHGKNASVTYHQQIERILQKNCQSCHREDGVGPFSLTSFDEAVSWAEDIKQFTADRTMPPWHPKDEHDLFQNRRAMSQAEIDLIGNWVDAGCPRGNPNDAPPPVVFPSGWQLGQPDVVLSPDSDYTIAADGPDDYRCFVLSTDFPQDKYLVAMEVLPSNNRVVHHVIAFLDTSGMARKLDERDPGPGYSTSQGFPGFFPRGSLGGWAPGNVARRLSHGMARVLPAGADLVIQVHYHKTGKAEKDRTRIGLYFSQEKVTRAVRTVPVMPFGGPLSGMRIPAGAKMHPVTATHMVPKDLLAVGITPHMHLLGRDMKVTATRPDGSKIVLLDLRRYDFNWQESYRYREPISLPVGTRLDLVAHFDNSTENPFNPHHPPKDVRWGPQTTDEMCIAFLDVAPQAEANSADELQAPEPGDVVVEQLRQAIGQKLRGSFLPEALRSGLAERFRRLPPIGTKASSKPKK